MTNADTLDFYEVITTNTTWRFNGSDQEEFLTQNMVDYYYPGLSVKRTQIQTTIQTEKSNVEIQIPVSYDLSQFILNAPFNEIMSLNIYTKRGGTTFIAWKGRLSNWKPASGFLTLTFESVFTSLRRPGLRPTFQRSCRHALYGETGCKVDPVSVEETLALQSIVDLTLGFLDLSSYAADYFVGGYLETPLGARSYIVGQSNTDNTVMIQRSSDSLTEEFANTGVGLLLNLYPGCNYSRDHCLNKFSNLDNYGGFDWIPFKNPTGGSSIV